MQTRKREMRWEELPANATQGQIWQTATRVLVWATRNYQRSQNPGQREELLRYARETFARKRGWLAVNNPEAARRFYRDNNQPRSAGENWIGQLVKLSNGYAYLESVAETSRAGDSSGGNNPTLEVAEDDLLYHARTRPTKSGHTHRAEENQEKGRILDDGKRYIMSRCGQFIANASISRMPTCQGCLTGAGTGRKPRRAGRDYISVKCPTCQAAAGENCTSYEAHPIPPSRQYHGAREYLAQLPACPECGEPTGEPCVDDADAEQKAPHGDRTQALQELREENTTAGSITGMVTGIMSPQGNPNA